MSHISHRDQWTGLLQRIVGTFFWWHPLTHGLSADFSQEREYVCDMYVSRHGNPRAFANCLLHLARDAQSVKGLPMAFCAITSTGFLEKRIRKIVSGGHIMKTRLSKKTFLVHVLVSMVVVGLLFSVNLTMADYSSINFPDEEIATGMEMDSPARIIRAFPPVFPPEAKENYIEGRVTIRLVVDTEGMPQELEIVGADPAGIFDQAALDAVSQYEFEPAVKDGMPVNSIVTLPVVFGLPDESGRVKWISGFALPDGAPAPERP
jgi:TonB family protein